MSSRVHILVGFVKCHSSNNGSRPMCTPDGEANAYSLEPNTDTSCKPIQSKCYLPTVMLKCNSPDIMLIALLAQLFHAQYNTQHITHSFRPCSLLQLMTKINTPSC